MVGPGETVNYLGAAFDPWLGPRPADIVKEIEAFGVDIARAELKPSQRITILTMYAVPRLVYKVVYGWPYKPQKS